MGRSLPVDAAQDAQCAQPEPWYGVRRGQVGDVSDCVGVWEPWNPDRITLHERDLPVGLLLDG